MFNVLRRHRPVHLVMGLSSVGKSRFIRSRLQAGVWKADMPLLMAYELEDTYFEVPRDGCIVHYNTLRPFENNPAALARDLDSDWALRQLLAQRHRLEVHFLIAPRSTLAKRILLRDDVEPDFRPQHEQLAYEAGDIFEILCRLDLGAVHQQCFDLLDRHQVQYRLIDAAGDEYRELESREEAIDLARSARHESYSEGEISHILDRFQFEYQGICLPSGHLTTGSDRSATLDIVLDADLAGKSVLDIGCAYGYFCFEAERRRASSVTGTELKPHRFVGANILREILGSDVRFLKRDVFAEGLEGKYDVVLFLNVLHHLAEPVRALRALAGWCTDKLVIEFPTLQDPKFQSTLGEGAPRDLNELPLIGVSLFEQCDQHFLFTTEAVRRILTLNAGTFEEIDFVQSPIAADRMIAICRRTSSRRTDREAP